MLNSTILQAGVLQGRIRGYGDSAEQRRGWVDREVFAELYIVPRN
jgi:hypothetical protein